ncbi:MAG: non-hydrolyzing UDP-N-acetylglucosamine 2-epimerase [Terriglobales bacterium]
MKIATVVGARPQFIKAAVVSRSLSSFPELCEVLVHTGQHYDREMSDCFFGELELRAPDYNLGIACNSHGTQTGRMLEAIERVLIAEQPHCVLVYGDTNSTLAGALAAAKLGFPVVHVEAGLRSFDRHQPEEINRVLADHVSSLLFAPTAQAIENLRREGVTENVHLSGDVMYDAALFYASRAEQRSLILQQLGLRHKQYVLATIHRAENTDNLRRLRTVLGALAKISAEIPVLLPLHPRTRKIMQREGMLDDTASRLHLTAPVGYLDMIQLEKHARLIATDSGGVQKEAFFHGVPCVTLRETTEWVELVEMGWNRLAPPTSIADVLAVINTALSTTPPPALDPYGGGIAGEQIARVLASQAGHLQATA